MKTKKILALALAAVLLVAVSVAGTIAYLVDTTGEVKNTFTAAGIDIDLTETKGLNAEGKWEMQLIPGTEKDKDPVVKVIRSTDDTQGTDVDIWLYVKFENEATDALTYESTLTTANGWTQGDGTTIPANVWYREVKAADTEIEWHLLKGDKVSVGNDVDKNQTATAFTMSWTAYAIQSTGLTAPEGWAQLNP